MPVHDEKTNQTQLTPGRLEAFSDGVMAIIITITVLDFKVPSGAQLSVLRPLVPLFLTYLISFQTIGTYWNNHHHLLRVLKHVSAGIMWANLSLLFWLSLIPFATGWLGENYGSVWPTVLYAVVLLMSGLAYTVLQVQVINHSEKREELLEEFRRGFKGPISLACYALAVVSALYYPPIADFLILLVAGMWFLPDRRIERHI